MGEDPEPCKGMGRAGRRDEVLWGAAPEAATGWLWRWAEPRKEPPSSSSLPPAIPGSCFAPLAARAKNEQGITG